MQTERSAADQRTRASRFMIDLQSHAWSYGRHLTCSILSKRAQIVRRFGTEPRLEPIHNPECRNPRPSNALYPIGLCPYYTVPITPYYTGIPTHFSENEPRISNYEWRQCHKLIKLTTSPKLPQRQLTTVLLSYHLPASSCLGDTDQPS